MKHWFCNFRSRKASKGAGRVAEEGELQRQDMVQILASLIKAQDE